MVHEHGVFWSTDRPWAGTKSHHRAQEDQINFCDVAVTVSPDLSCLPVQRGRRTWEAIDVVVMFLAGVIGFFLRRSGYSVAGIVLGLILGKIGEQTFAQAMQMLHFVWSGYFDRPIALGLLIAGFLTLGGSIYGAFFKKGKRPSIGAAG